MNRYGLPNFSFLVILLILICSGPILPRQSGLQSDYADAGIDRYYTKLILSSNGSSRKQISELQIFLSQNPKFELAFEHLMHLMLHHRMQNEAAAFFDSLSRKSATRRNATWMSARLMDIQGEHMQAHKTYRLALQAGSYSYRILDRYVAFLHKHRDKYDFKKEINKLRLSANNRNFVFASWYRRQLTHQKAVDALLKLPDYDRDNLTLHILAHCYQQLGKQSKAIEFYQKGLQLAKLNGNTHFDIYNRISLALMQDIQRNYEAAETMYKKALEDAVIIKDHRLQLLAQANLATIYQKQSRYKESIFLFRESNKIAIAIGQYGTAARNYRGLSQCYFNLENYDLVLGALDSSEVLARQVNATSELFSILLEKGRFYGHLNLKSYEREEYARVYNMSAKASHRQFRIPAYTRYADLLVEEEKYQTARKIYHELIQSGSSTAYLTYWQWKIADSYLKGGNKKEARQALNTTKSYIQKLKPGNYTNSILVNIELRRAAMESDDGNHAEALAILEDSLTKSFSTLTTEIAIDYAVELGRSYRSLGKLQKALSQFKHAFELSEESREEIKVEMLQIGQFSTQIAPYDELINTYFNLYQANPLQSTVDTLMYYMALSRSRALRDFDSQSDPDTSNPQNELRTDISTISQKLQAIQTQMRLDPRRFDDLSKSQSSARYELISKRIQLLENTHKQDSSKHFQTVKFPFDAFQHLDIGMLHYHITEDASFAIVRTKDTTNAVELNLNSRQFTKAIQELITPFLGYIPQKELAKVPFRADIAHQLYKQLFAPVAENISLPPNLIVVPDLEMIQLPLEMLLTESPDKSSYYPTDSTPYHQHFLLNKHAIIYSPDSEIDHMTLKGTRRMPAILTLSNPTIPRPAMFTVSEPSAPWLSSSPLWYAEKEADSIKGIYPRTTILKRDKATMQALKDHLGQHNILHFSTHGFIDNKFDAFSGLVLAVGEDSKEDGLLMGYEIADLNLKDYDLVVLSACETGRGQAMPGEGLLGLPRIILKQGARRVIMTAWPVDDRFSAKLMPIFYRSLLGDSKSGEFEALSLAKRSMLAKNVYLDFYDITFYYQHPLFWAPFVMYGAPNIPVSDGSIPPWQIALGVTLIASLFGLAYITLPGFSNWIIRHLRIRRA